MSIGNVSKAVLITGCSTGIGRATAQHLAARGWTVYATARRPESIEDLAAHGCRLLRIDVCDEPSMQRAVEIVEAEEGAVGVLVNNAGYGLEGPVEEAPLDELRRQFETNLFGPTRLTQLVLSGMRRQGWGKIVNVSSVGGRITIPGGGAYHASKHALEALSDALRFEVRGFGIDVILIEPGAIRSSWVDTAVGSMRRPRDRHSPYAAFVDAVANRLRGAHEGLLALAAAGPDPVAHVIERAITARRPRTRYPVPAAAALFIISRRLLPDRAWDASMRRLLPSPGAPGPANHHRDRGLGERHRARPGE
jgi:NAD(P)-dependent dehydrogenase (short-subunit alcohol dehydrogenase family)